MSKKQRHELKKIERTRYRRSSSHSDSARPRRPSRSVVRDGAKALAAAAAIAGGTQAYATPVRFENPPGPEHFIWLNHRLDVTDPASAQPGLSGAGSFLHWDYLYFEVSWVGGGGQLQGRAPSYYSFLAGVTAGDTIPSGFDWLGDGYSFYYRSLLPESVATYLGIRFDLGAGNQYGWIGVERTGKELDAFAWGYETDPGVSIVAGVPEPGTLALLAFGAGAAATRRRRDHSN